MHRALFTGRPRWVKAWHLFLCVLRVWETADCLEPAPDPLLEGLAKVPLCLSQRLLVLDGLGGSDIVQGWARNGRQQEGVRPGAR